MSAKRRLTLLESSSKLTNTFEFTLRPFSTFLGRKYALIQINNHMNA